MWQLVAPLLVSLITPYVRGLLGVGGWEGWLSVVPLVLCVCIERASEWGMAMRVRSWTLDTTCRGPWGLALYVGAMGSGGHV